MTMALATGALESASGACGLAAIRDEFPILAEKVHGNDLVYLDNAASSQKPLCVSEALTKYYASQHANVHRGVHALSERATEVYENARTRAQHFVNAASSCEIIFVRGTSEALNLVADSYGRSQLRQGDEILVSEMEHHSNIVPWQLIAERVGAKVRMIPMNDDGEIIQAEYARLLGSKSRIVAITYVANSLGTVNPVRRMTELAHDAGAVIVVDAAQAAPHMKIDVQELNCDFLALSSHKMYGPTGIGILYGRESLLEAMPPYQGGGEMIKRVTFEGSEYAELPHKFEAGTPNVADAGGLDAAIQFMERIGFDQLARHEDILLSHIHRCAAEYDDIRVFGNAKHKSGVFAFEVEGIHPHDLGTILDQQGIAVRAGHHCAMPVMLHYDVAATTRASVAVYNTIDEIDKLFEGLELARELFGT